MGVSFNCVLNQDFITMLRFGFLLSTLAVASLANQQGQPTSGTTGSQSNPFPGNPNPFAGQPNPGPNGNQQQPLFGFHPNPNGFPFAAPAPRPMDPTMMVLMMTMMGGNNGDMTLPMMMMLMDQDGDDNMMLMMMVMMMNGGNNQDMLIPMMLLINNNKKDEMKR